MAQAMTSRERVLAALARQEPDRVPVDYSANGGIDRRLKAHFGLAEGDGEGLMQALGVDFRGVGVPYRGPKLHPDVPGRRVDLWGIRTRWVEHESGGYWDFCDYPLAEATVDEVMAWPMPSPDDFDYTGVAERCRQLAPYARFTGGAGLGDTINSAGMIRTMEQVLVDLAGDDEAGLAYIDRRHAVQLAITERTLEAARGGIDFLWLGEDLGTQRGPLMSLALFRKHIRPRLQGFVDLAKAYGLPVMIHSCGSSSWAFDDFIEMGIAAVDTLQPEAEAMSPAYLKERYGERLAFHGCISTAGAMAGGTRADVEAEVRATLATMMPGGGYMLAPTHAIQDNSPTENVLAVYRLAREWGQYA